MPNESKQNFLTRLKDKFGDYKRIPGSLSLFDIGEGQLRIYYRYSKVHPRNQTFYGLRNEDLKLLEGRNAIICFDSDRNTEPLFIPYGDYEEVLNEMEPASDGQIKASIFFGEENELYLPGFARFNVDAYVGWQVLDLLVDTNKLTQIPDFSHSQIQTLIGAIGFSKGYDIWIPQSDRTKLDWQLSEKFILRNTIPDRYSQINPIIKEIDVLWIQKGSTDLEAMFEVEHSTTIYSGLLRFNDLHLTEPKLKPKFNIVSNEMRKALFLRQINRPTFKLSGLIDYCNFLEYKDVFAWFNRINKN